MTLADLLIKIGIEGADKVKSTLKDIGTEGGKAEKSTSKLEDSLAKFSSLPGPLGEVAGKLSDIKGTAGDAKDGVNLAKGAVTELGGAASLVVPILATVGVGLLALAGIGATIKFADQIDDLGDLAEKLGYSATQTQIFKQQLESAGTSIEAYTSAQQRVALAVSKTGDEGSKASEALKRMGVNFDSSTSIAEVATRTAAAYQAKLAEGNVTAQDAADIQLILGKSYRESILAIGEMEKAQERLNYFQLVGIGISADGQAAASKLEAANNNLGTTMTAVGSILVGEVVPPFAAFIQQLSDSYTEGGILAGVVGLIRVAFQAILIPIRTVLLALVGVDTAVQMFGKTVGAVMAAIGTQSRAPLDALANDLDRIANRAADRVNEIKNLGFDSGVIEGPKSPTVAAGTPADDGEKERDSLRKKALQDLLQAKKQLLSLEEKLGDQMLASLGKDVDSVKFNRELNDILSRRVDLSNSEKDSIREKLNAQREATKSNEIYGKSSAIIKEELEKQVEKSIQLSVADADRVKLSEKLTKAIDDYRNKAKSVLPETLATMEAQKEQTLNQYDQNKAVADQQKMAQLVTKEYERQSDLVSQIIQKNQEAIRTAQSEFDNRNKTRKERDGESFRDKIVGPLNASINVAETEISQKKAKGVKTDEDSAYIDARMKRIAELKESIALAEASVNQILSARDAAEKSIDEGITRGITRSLDQLPTLAEGVTNVLTTTTKGLEDGLFNLFTKGEFDIKSFFSMLINEIAKLFIQLTIIKPMLDYFRASLTGGSLLGGLLGGGSAAASSTLFSGAASTATFAANGAAYQQGVKMYASGDVFNSPTMFNSNKGLGILGEAGPEAIMPLKRGMDGKLGIANVGGSSSSGLVIQGGINVTVQGGNTNEQTGDVVSKKIMEMMKGVARQEIMGARRVGGSLNPI